MSFETTPAQAAELGFLQAILEKSGKIVTSVKTFVLSAFRKATSWIPASTRTTLASQAKGWGSWVGIGLLSIRGVFGRAVRFVSNLIAVGLEATYRATGWVVENVLGTVLRWGAYPVSWFARETDPVTGRKIMVDRYLSRVETIVLYCNVGILATARFFDSAINRVFMASKNEVVTSTATVTASFAAGSALLGVFGFHMTLPAMLAGIPVLSWTLTALLSGGWAALLAILGVSAAALLAVIAYELITRKPVTDRLLSVTDPAPAAEPVDTAPGAPASAEEVFTITDAPVATVEGSMALAETKGNLKVDLEAAPDVEAAKAFEGITHLDEVPDDNPLKAPIQEASDNAAAEEIVNMRRQIHGQHTQGKQGQRKQGQRK